MTTEDAILWCKNRGVEISFTSTADHKSIEVYSAEMGRIEGATLVDAVEKLREKRQLAQYPMDATPLEALNFSGRNCRGRLIRAARAVRASTVGELLDWAERQPHGLKEITSFHNVGETSYQVLVEALEDHGVKGIPYADSSWAA